MYRKLGVVGFEPTYPEGVRFTVTSNTIPYNHTQHLSAYKTSLYAKINSIIYWGLLPVDG